MKDRLRGKVSVITGAGSGIGRATALLFAEHGSKVVVNDISQQSAQQTVDAILSSGGHAKLGVADVTDFTAIRDLIDETVATLGSIDILFNNAGGAAPATTHEMPQETYRKIVALNLDAVFYGIRAALPHMIKQRSGVILSTSSGAGINAVNGLAAYGAAKAGVISLSKNIATEYGHYGIRSNVISPGPMDTPALRGLLAALPGGAERYASSIPVKRLGTAEDIANTALFLASDEASFISGSLVAVDGAIHAKLSSGVPE